MDIFFLFYVFQVLSISYVCFLYFEKSVKKTTVMLNL